MSVPRVLLADDHELVAEGLRRVLEEEFEVLAVVHDGRALLQAAAKLSPDVVVVDLSMPLLNGIEATRELKSTSPTIKVVVLTQHSDIEFAESAFRAGADAFLVKSGAAEELGIAVRRVLDGRRYATPKVVKDSLDFFARRMPEGEKRAEKLTPRQREVLQLIAEGQAMKEIARTLNVSPKTVEFHRYNVMRELDLHTTAELTRYAIQNGIASLQ